MKGGLGYLNLHTDVFHKDWNHIVQDMALPKAGIRRRSGEVKARLDKWIYSTLVVIVALVAVIVGLVVTSIQQIRIV